jgi:hypothetical protein
MAHAHKIIDLNKHLKNITILLVDNDEMVSRLMMRVLKYLGFRNIILAVDGFTAVRAMEQNDIAPAQSRCAGESSGKSPPAHRALAAGAA